jgi:hypothetical protein
MKKRTISVIASVAIAVVMLLMAASCASSTATKAYEQAKMSMATSDYKSALNYLKLAKSEGLEDNNLDELVNVLQGYLNAKDAYDADNIDGAKTALASIPAGYTTYSIASDIEALKTQVSAKQSNMGDIDSQIAGVRAMMSYGDYVSAGANITELYTKNLTEYQKKQVDELNNTLTAANNKISAEASKKPDVVYVEKEVPATSGNTNVVATYYVVNCNEWITLRSTPSTSASSVAKIPLGKAVGYIENAGNGFYKINYDGAVGYALSQYLSSAKPGISSSSSSTRTGQVVNCNEWITLRATASVDSASLAQIPLGAYVTIYGDGGNGFYSASYNGRSGYVLKQYIALR